MSSITPENKSEVTSSDPIAATIAAPVATKREPDPEDKDLKELLHLIAQVSPHFAQAAMKNTEQETIRHRNELCWWSLPFLVSIVLLGGGVLVLAGMAIYKDKADLAVTIIGYLLTFLGGVGTGRTMTRKPG